MRLTIHFISSEVVKLPSSYNELVQGFIYTHLPSKLASFLHDEGYKNRGRTFKLFTFSRLIGKIKMEKDVFVIESPFKLVISSPSRYLLEAFTEKVLKEPEVTLGDNRLTVQSVEVQFSLSFQSEIEIKMLSPVTVYSTLITADGKKKTYYYNPKEDEFPSLIKENIIKKYTSFYGSPPEDREFNIEPINVSKKDEKIITYKGFVIKGWMGKYKLTGVPELLKLAYDAGIGSKNSQGFGCFEVINEQKQQV